MGESNINRAFSRISYLFKIEFQKYFTVFLYSLLPNYAFFPPGGELLNPLLIKSLRAFHETIAHELHHVVIAFFKGPKRWNSHGDKSGL